MFFPEIHLEYYVNDHPTGINLEVPSNYAVKEEKLCQKEAVLDSFFTQEYNTHLLKMY